MNILLVEPNYQSTFPPLGLLRISAFFKSMGVTPILTRGLDPSCKNLQWDKIYISSLFTYELPRTVKTISYYKDSIANPEENIVVGGVGASLMPEYIREKAVCKVITGPLCKGKELGFNEPPIATCIPDYDILTTVGKKYKPDDVYFTRITLGCIRNCGFCAVPKLEPDFQYLQGLSEQVNSVDEQYGARRDLVILDNNILALKNVEDILLEIKGLGFQKGAKVNNVKRYVDFNQGIDIRLITPRLAKLLGEICVDPVRIAFDHKSIEKKYKSGVKLLVDNGITNIVTYIMYNYLDTPEDFYHRLQVNVKLNKEYKISITGFPMRYVPISDVNRQFISKHWNWRYLRGIQCILNATHGMVSPNPEFIKVAFGKDFTEFTNIISMPDPYIIYRTKYSSEARDWQSSFSKLNEKEQSEFLKLVHEYHDTKMIPKYENPKFTQLITKY